MSSLIYRIRSFLGLDEEEEYAEVSIDYAGMDKSVSIRLKSNDSIDYLVRKARELMNDLMSDHD